MDISLTFATSLLFHYFLKDLRSPDWGNTVAQGLLFGWAVAVKYTAVYFAPLILLTVWMSEARGWVHRLKKIIACVALSLLVYAMISPYSFLDWHNFISQVKYQSGARGYAGYSHHLIYSLMGGTGVLFLISSVMGALIMLKKRPREGLVLAGGFIIYYFVNVYFSQNFARYMMPLVPMMCLWAGVMVDWLMTRSSNKRLKYGALAVILMELAAPTVYGDYLFTTEDTRTECVRWFERNVPENTSVGVDNRFFGPQLLQSADQIRQKYEYLDSSGKETAKKARLDLLLQSIGARKTYNVYLLTSDQQRTTPFLFLRPYADETLEGLKKINAKYLVVNYADPDAGTQRFIGSIKDRLELIQSFSPYWSRIKKRSVDRWDLTAAPHLPGEIFSRKSLGPYLEVYRVKDV